MKFVTVVPYAALVVAIVLPDPGVFNALPVHEERTHEVSTWLDWLPSTYAIRQSVNDAADALTEGIENAVHTLESKFEEGLEQGFDDEVDDFDVEQKPRHGHHLSNLTIYQLISKSKYTIRLAKLVDEYDDIVQLLNSTKANYTLFAPIDSAFEHIPKDRKPSKEFVEAVLKYHVGVGLYPAGRILATHTLPTTLTEPLLGGKPQRLRTSVGILSGVRVNFYSKVVAVDIRAKNGVIHAVRSLLIPPPAVGRELSLLPGKFSTLLLAYEKTDFASLIHSVKTNGSTVFAPTNAAFAKLGPAANAFLFNTEKGLKYLNAILKYHIVANETVYSDAYYSNGEEKELEPAGHNGHYHLDLPTLLADKSVAVDIARFGGFIKVKINGYVPVVVQDGIAKDGVIQVLGRVLIPPHKHGKVDEAGLDGEISVDYLIERLSDYVGDEGAQVYVGKQRTSELELEL